jgi:Rrf2 family protein
LATLARTDGSGRADLHSLSEELEAPSAFLGKTLQALARAGLVSGSRGAKGGYRLARSPEEIAVRDIVEAVEGSVRLASCTAPEGKCERGRLCAAGRFWGRLQDRINDALASETLASLLEEMHVSRNRSR